MIDKIKSFFIRKKVKTTQYGGFSDFFVNAPEEVKIKVIKEAAQKANEDQLKVFKEAQLKVDAQ